MTFRMTFGSFRVNLAPSLLFLCDRITSTKLIRPIIRQNAAIQRFMPLAIPLWTENILINFRVPIPKIRYVANTAKGKGTEGKGTGKLWGLF